MRGHGLGKRLPCLGARCQCKWQKTLQRHSPSLVSRRVGMQQVQRVAVCMEGGKFLASAGVHYRIALFQLVVCTSASIGKRVSIRKTDMLVYESKRMSRRYQDAPDNGRAMGLRGCLHHFCLCTVHVPEKYARNAHLGGRRNELEDRRWNKFIGECDDSEFYQCRVVWV